MHWLWAHEYKFWIEFVSVFPLDALQNAVHPYIKLFMYWYLCPSHGSDAKCAANLLMLFVEIYILPQMVSHSYKVSSRKAMSGSEDPECSHVCGSFSSELLVKRKTH